MQTGTEFGLTASKKEVRFNTGGTYITLQPKRVLNFKGNLVVLSKLTLNYKNFFDNENEISFFRIMNQISEKVVIPSNESGGLYPFPHLVEAQSKAFNAISQQNSCIKWHAKLRHIGAERLTMALEHVFGVHQVECAIFIAFEAMQTSHWTWLASEKVIVATPITLFNGIQFKVIPNRSSPYQIYSPIEIYLL